jgi:hypothetical protein
MESEHVKRKKKEQGRNPRHERGPAQSIITTKQPGPISVDRVPENRKHPEVLEERPVT